MVKKQDLYWPLDEIYTLAIWENGIKINLTFWVWALTFPIITVVTVS